MSMTSASTSTGSAGSIGPMRLVFLGAPGAGKGTQAKVLEERFGTRQISTGDILRKNVADGTELGKRAQEFMGKGGLVPDEIIVGMMESRLAAIDDFILDGFPRTVAQAQALDAMLARLKKPLTTIVVFDADRETLKKRLTGRWTNPRSGRTYHMEFNPPKVAGIDDEDGGPLVQRPDDTLDVVQKRLDVFDLETAPLVDYYRPSGLLVKIDGLKSIDEVTAQVLAAIAKRKDGPAS
jgi:adenylate kinase